MGFCGLRHSDVIVSNVKITAATFVLPFNLHLTRLNDLINSENLSSRTLQSAARCCSQNNHDDGITGWGNDPRRPPDTVAAAVTELGCYLEGRDPIKLRIGRCFTGRILRAGSVDERNCRIDQALGTSKEKVRSEYSPILAVS